MLKRIWQLLWKWQDPLDDSIRRRMKRALLKAAEQERRMKRHAGPSVGKLQEEG